MPKLMLISADGHAGVKPTDYANWLDPKYRDGVADLIAQSEHFSNNLVWSVVRDEATKPIIDPRDAIEGGGKEGLWDPARRLAELEGEGFVAEIIFPGDASTLGMYYSNLNRPCPAEYRVAGAKAHNRWLAEFCSYAPGRFLGVAQMEPWPDMEACVREIHWARKAGLGAIALPRFPGLEANQPPLTSTAWDPFWAACVENDITASVHIGHLHQQGSALPVMEEANLKDKGYPDGGANGDIHFDAGRRPLWQLIMSGVFDRFPTLRLTFTELRTEWIAPTLAHLEQRFDAIRFGRSDLKLPKLRPTDYWLRNCGVANQFRPYDVSLRQQIGVGTMMFGTDYPHPEGSWPNSREWLRLILKGVPEADARLILGENAARLYAIDTAALAPHVARVGPEVADLLGEHRVAPELIDNFQWRGGFLSRAIRYDPDPIDAIMQEDERALIDA